MKKYDFGIIGIIIIMICAGVIGFVSHMIYKKDDAPLEQMAEEILKDSTGISMDFSSPHLFKENN